MSEERITGITFDVKPIKKRSAVLEDETIRVYQIIKELIKFSYGLIDPSVHKVKQQTDEEKLNTINKKWEEEFGKLSSVLDESNRKHYVRLQRRYQLYSKKEITLIDFLKTAEGVSNDLVNEIDDRNSGIQQ